MVRSGMSFEDLWPLLAQGTLETLYMVGLAALFTVLIGLPVGVVLFITRRDGVLPQPQLNSVLGSVINVGRSLPFIVLLIALIPLTRLIIGTTLGSTAAVVPITIGAFPFFARVVENALDEVDRGARRGDYCDGRQRLACNKQSAAAGGAARVAFWRDTYRGDADRLFLYGRCYWRRRAWRSRHSLRLSAF
ncbi:D-methionine transport system permease protein metI [Cronobacter sakazakii]|nr:D-methionine transport system permease protein metI [Cronobacter sakazakii]